MRKFILVAATTLIAVTGSHSQVRPKPQAEDVQQAKTLRKEFPKDDFVALNKQVQYTFTLEKSKKGDRVFAHLHSREEILQIKEGSNVSYLTTVGYDSTSNIEKTKFMHKKDRELKTLGVTGSSSYEEDGIFHSDARIFKIAFPMDGQGCFTAYEYVKNYEEIKYLTSHYFHEYYPVLKQTVSFTIP